MRPVPSFGGFLFLVAFMAPAQQTAITPVNVSAIVAALGVDERALHGLVTVRLFLLGGGGYLQAPPSAVDGSLCRVDRYFFEGTAATGYKPSDLDPQVLYWHRDGFSTCGARTSDDIPRLTSLQPGVAETDVSTVLGRTLELIREVRDFPRCEPGARFWQMPDLLPSFIYRLGPARYDSNGALEAAFGATDDGQGWSATFSLVDDRFVLHRVCNASWEPFAYENSVWDFVLP